MDTRIPTPIRDILRDYMDLLAHELPGLVTGLYLHGSIALDAFNEHQSDIDFIALLSRRATATDIETLRAVHKTLASKYSRWALEGSYLQWHELGQLEESVAPAPTHHDGKLDGDATFDVNSVTWWVLKYHGIALIGPQPQGLDFEVDWQLLISAMHENLNRYWASYTRKPKRIAWLLSNFGIEWTVLGVLRQYYSFVAHDIISKTGAGEYALTHLPTKWHRLIREALQIRNQLPATPHKSLYNSKVARAADAYNFLRYIIDYCNSLPQ